MQAIEYGAGYRVEWENTLYIVPTPLILIDGQNRFHSEEAPAIRWKGGKEFYYLFGENFEKALWSKIVSKKITAAEVMKISDSDKRTIAMSLLSPKEMLKQLKAKLMHTGIKGNKLYESENFMSTGETEYFLVMKDSSTPRQFIQGIPRDIGRKGNADLATASAFVNERGKSISLKQYLSIKEEA